MSPSLLTPLVALALIGSVSADSGLNKIFPLIKVDYVPFALTVITKYAEEHDWPPIDDNTARVVIQPMGFVSRAYRVDLNAGDVIKYPGTHSEDAPQTVNLSADELKTFRDLLQSKDFLAIPPQDQTITGLDGASVFIEVSIDNRYQWILRWCPEEELILRTYKFLDAVYENHK